MIKINCNSDS